MRASSRRRHDHDALTLLQDGAGPLAVLATVAVVNCRLALYAAALAPRFADQPGWFRWLAPQVLLDQTYAITTARPDLRGAALRRYWITAGGAFALGWLASNAAGLLRAGFIAVFPAQRLGKRLRRALRHVGPAVLGAMIITMLVGHGGLRALVTPSAAHLALLVAVPMAAALTVMLVAGLVA